MNPRSKYLTLLLLSIMFIHARAQRSEFAPPLVHNAPILLAQYNDDNELIITSSSDGIVKLWDARFGKPIRAFRLDQRVCKDFFAALSPDGKLLAVINGRALKMWNTKFGDILFSFQAHGDTIKSMHFSKNSKWVATSSLDGSAKLWDMSGKHHHSVNQLNKSLQKEETAAITEAKFCNGEKWLITGSRQRRETGKAMDSAFSVNTRYDIQRWDSTARVLDLQSGKIIYSIRGYPFSVSEDNKFIVSGSETMSDQSAKIWEVQTGKLVRTLEGHHGKVTTCEFSGNGKWILTVSNEAGSCKLWDALSGKALYELNVGAGNVRNTAQFSPDSKWVAIFSSDTSKTWDAASGKLLYAIPADKPIAFSHDSLRIIVITGKQARICESLSGKPINAEKGKGLAAPRPKKLKYS